MIQASNAFSRRSRRPEYCRNGSMLEREQSDGVLALMPTLVRRLRCRSSHRFRQAGKVASPSSTSTKACSSASRFWLKCVPSTDMRAAIAAIRFLALARAAATRLDEGAVVALQHALLLFAQLQLLGAS